MKHLSAPEPLETRIALNGSAIAKALGVPAGGSVIDYSQASAIGVGSNFGVDGLIGFPTGADDRFVILSTGDATKFNLPGYSHRGTDWTSKGPPGDDVFVDIALPVPTGATRLKLDFVFLTQENYDNYNGAGFVNEFEDYFKITANAGGPTETLVDYNVDNVFYYPGADAGPNFKHRTLLLTMNYQVPVGATNISLHMELGDDNDGLGDTAVIMDNLRFEQSSNVVFLNFNGGSTSALGPGTTLTMPAFQPSDLGYPVGTDRDTIINEIVAEVEAKYAPFDVSFVTTQPVAGDYTTVMIGGNQNSPVTLGGAANPLLVKQYPSGTTFATITGLNAASTLFGQALGGVDVGNKNTTDVTVVFPQSFASFYPDDSAATREDRMVVTIAHELGHALGLRHIESSDASDPNIMKQQSPRSSTAGFEDLTRALAADELGLWADKATQLNTAAYLRSTLGSATGSDLELGVSPLALNKYLIALISSLFGGSLYNAYLGVIPGQPLDSDEAQASLTPQMFKVGDLNGDQFLQIPITSTADKLVFWGQSTPGGPVDVFSGQHTGGILNFADSAVSLFDGAGNLNLNFPTSFGDPSAGALVDGPVLGMQASNFRLALLPFGTYQDTPPVGSTVGDLYTIKLTTKTGAGGFTMLDPDGDGKGPIDQIVLQDTTIKDKLLITVKKPTADQLIAGLDGRVNIGAITAPTLASIDAKASDLVGAGVDVGNLLGSLAIRDVLNGADISIGGGEFMKTKITAHVIADGTAIVSRATIGSLTAARIGIGTIDAPGIGTINVTGDKKLSIAGDFRSDVTLAHSSPFITAATLKKSLLGSVSIAGVTEGATFDVGGHVGSFKTARFVDSELDLSGFIFNPADPTNNYVKLGSFKATGIKGLADPAFENSNIIAGIIGSATLASVDTANGGLSFGITADTKIGSVSAAVLLPGPGSFKYDAKGAASQSSGDFAVQLV